MLLQPPLLQLVIVNPHWLLRIMSITFKIHLMSDTSVITTNLQQNPIIQTGEGAQPISNFYGFTPLKSGSLLPHFLHPSSLLRHPVTQYVTTNSNTYPEDEPVLPGLTSSKSLFITERPLVIIFRPVFLENDFNQQVFLEALEADIQVMGGSLLVITNASVRNLTRQPGGQLRRSSYQILSDPQNSVAEKFGLYHPDNLPGDWLSGVDGDIALPAFYLLNEQGIIDYHYIDYNFRTYTPLPDSSDNGVIRKLLTKVYQNSQKTNRRFKVAFGA